MLLNVIADVAVVTVAVAKASKAPAFTKGAAVKALSPYAPALTDLADKIGTVSPYANLVCDANTVYVADAVLIIVITYESIDDAFPAVGAVPPCHFVVTPDVVPSI